MLKRHINLNGRVVEEELSPEEEAAVLARWAIEDRPKTPEQKAAEAAELLDKTLSANPALKAIVEWVAQSQGTDLETAKHQIASKRAARM